MSQSKVQKTLEKEKRWMTVEEIHIKTNLSNSSINNSLMKMGKYNEVQVRKLKGNKFTYKIK